ncbi:hypothetical protein [Rhodovibrio sodomensis]|uniref:hypothetical protein n=1 Tax=Rhodovibrio sodomensis TaxID=1088 RepID=UPI001906E119|nr:hypothetical protein [Rhodovibrio sodomensis]
MIGLLVRLTTISLILFNLIIVIASLTGHLTAPVWVGVLLFLSAPILGFADRFFFVVIRKIARAAA